MQVEVSESVQLHWRQQRSEFAKFDDLGDALLHALDEILCGSSNYRPLVPSTPSLHTNRSIVLTVQRSTLYWVVIQCTWNVFTIENLGVSKLRFPATQKFASREAVELIMHHLNGDLRQPMTTMSGSDIYSAVEHIKTIVKQVTGDKADNFSNKAAGALTTSTLEAVKNIYDEAAGKESRLVIRNTKQEGWAYVRTLASGEKLQLLRSTGKHTNAVLAFLEWTKENTPDFIKKRPLHMNAKEMLRFFRSLKNISASENGPYRMEMLRLTDHVAGMLRSRKFSLQQTQKILSDLVLIGLNKNGQYVSALAPSYRGDASRKRK